MYTTPEQFAELNKANVAQATKLAALAFENAEKLMKLNLDAAKSALAQGVESASAAASVKDVQELFALRTKYAETGVQAALGYSRSLYDVASAAQAQYSQLAEETWTAYTKGVAAWVRRPADQAHPAPPARMSPSSNFKSTFAASTAAFDQFQKATKQVVSLADASVRAAAANAAKAAPKGRKAA